MVASLPPFIALREVLLCGRGLPRAGYSSGHSCERNFSCTGNVARGRATSREGFRLRQFGMQRQAKRNFVRFALSVTAFHFLLSSRTPSASPRLRVRFSVRFAHTHGFTLVARLSVIPLAALASLPPFIALRENPSVFIYKNRE